MKIESIGHSFLFSFITMFTLDLNKAIIHSSHFTDSSDKGNKVSHAHWNPSAKSPAIDSVILNSLSEILMSMFASRMVYYHSTPYEHFSMGRLNTIESISESLISSESLSIDGVSTSRYDYDDSNYSSREVESKPEY